MAGSTGFIRKYGDVSFTEKPFCDADNLALCQVFYMPLEKAAPNGFDDEPMPFSDVCDKMFELNGGKHVAVGLVLTKGISVKLMEMAATKRYSEMKVAACYEVYQEDPAIQFAAATFLLPDGTAVITFRGTDDTLIGWLEDLEIYTKKGIPSHSLAVDYIEKAAAKFSGDIIICGHSKGGNVALFGALNCSAEVRSRIKCIYNNDGPGFYSYEFIESEAYKELLPKYKHFIPNSSLVGILLAHDDDYTTVRSSRLTGPLQHDLGTWQVDGDELVTTDGLSPLGKLNDLTLAKIIMKVTDEQSDVLEKVAVAVIKGTGQMGLLGFAKNLPSSVKGAKEAWQSMDDETKTDFHEIFAGSADALKLAARTMQEETFPTVTKRVSNIMDMIFTDIRHKEKDLTPAEA